MMYSDRLVAVIKVDGKVLRESGDVVTLPFGSEYEVFIKNLNSVRAMVKVTVDGVDATEGCKLIVDANGSTSLERFIKNGNFSKGNRFKFIERTSKIEEHRGVGVEDGLIRIEYWFEKLAPKIEKKTIIETHEHHHHHHNDYWGPWYYPHYTLLGGQQTQPNITYTCNTSGNIGSVDTVNTSNVHQQSMNMLRSASFTKSSAGTESFTKSAPSADSFNMDFMETSFGDRSLNLNDAGITVPGSVSNQRFTHGSWFATEEQSHVLVLKLKGKVGEKKVVQAVTVDHKPECPTCGRKNKANAKFCSECGTALELI